jgi:hypothetical protein
MAKKFSTEFKLDEMSWQAIVERVNRPENVRLAIISGRHVVRNGTDYFGSFPKERG